MKNRIPPNIVPAKYNTFTVFYDRVNRANISVHKGTHFSFGEQNALYFISKKEDFDKRMIKHYTNNLVEIMYFIIFFSDLDDILLYMNGEIKSNIELNENAPLTISCHVDGNPAPTIRLSRGQGYTELEQRQGTWLNYTIDMAQCTDTDTYTCSGSSTGSNITDKVININVLCKNHVHVLSTS